MSKTFLKDTPAMFLKQLIKRKYPLDQAIAIALLCLSILGVILSFVLGYFSGMALIIAVMVGALVYLTLRNKLATGNDMSSFRLGSQIRPLCHIIFVITLSLMVYIAWSSVDYRPPIFFLLLLVATASIVLDIFALDSTKRSHISIALFKIIILSVTVYLSIYHEFPGIWGVDSWWHNRWTQETINLGHITRGEIVSNDYYLFPFFHIWSAITQIVTRVSTYDAVFLGTGVMTAITSLFVFLIGEKLVNVKVGLLAALVVPLTSQAISRSTNIISMSLAFCFFPAILYLILTRDKKRASDILLVILFSTALILTHTVAALVMLVSLIVIYFSIKFIRRIGKISFSYEAVSLTLVAFFGIFMLFRWMQPPPDQRPFFDMNLDTLVETIRFEARFVMAGPATVKPVAPAVTIFDDGGYLLLLVFGVIGALAFLHRKNRTGLIMALVSLTAFLTILPQLFNALSLTNLLPDRWFTFTYVVLSIVAVSGLIRISGVIPGNIGKIGAVLLIVLAGMFMMTTNSKANADSPMVFNGAVRTGYTQSELNVINTLCDIGGGRPTTDHYYGSIFPYVVDFDRYQNLLQEKSRVFIQRNYYLRHPEWNQYYIERIRLGWLYDVGARRELISDYMKVWGIDDWPIIYRNNTVTIYSDASLPAPNR